MDRWTDGQMDGQTDKWTGKRINHSSEKAKSDLMLVKPRELVTPGDERNGHTECPMHRDRLSSFTNISRSSSSNRNTH